MIREVASDARRAPDGRQNRLRGRRRQLSNSHCPGPSSTLPWLLIPIWGWTHAQLFTFPIGDVGRRAALADDEVYQLGADSVRRDDVPRGKVSEHVWRSDVFPGTIRRYWVYVPAQYDGREPAAVMVFQDGHAYVAEEGQFRVPGGVG